MHDYVVTFGGGGVIFEFRFAAVIRGLPDEEQHSRACWGTRTEKVESAHSGVDGTGAPAIRRQLSQSSRELARIEGFGNRDFVAVSNGGRFARFASELRRIARDTGCVLLDVDAVPEMGGLGMWAEDRVHLQAVGHRFLAYRAAEVLGVPDAEALGELDAALHADEDAPVPSLPSRVWLRLHAIPWMLRRMAGRTAGDGIAAKHDGYVELRPRSTTRRAEA